MKKLLVGESQERIQYLARICAIFEKLYGIKDLHEAEFRATTNAGVAAKMLSELVTVMNASLNKVNKAGR